MTTITDLENGVLAYFSTAWGTRTEISWAAQNVAFQNSNIRTGFDDNSTYIIPRLQQVSAESSEFPVNSGGRKVDYQLILNLVTEPQTGMSNLQGHLSRLRDIFELKTIIVSDASLQFEMLRTQSGFMIDKGDAFEVPCSIFFETTIFPT